MNQIGLPPHTVRRMVTATEANQRLPWWLTDYGVTDHWPVDAARNTAVSVGIVDTGVDGRHRGAGDLQGAVKATRDFTISVSTESHDTNGHGTHVAGIIGARDNQQGIAGMDPNCKLFIAKALGDDGHGRDDWVADGITWCVDRGCRVVNCSLGGPHPSDTILRAIEGATRAGVMVPCAGGNDGSPNGLGYPAGHHQHVPSIGAIDQMQMVARFSNRSPRLDVVAPGVGIRSLWRNGGLAELDGTSMATPWVTGLISLRLSLGITPVIDNVHALRSLFDISCEDLGTPGRDAAAGRGVPIPERFMQGDSEPTTPPGENGGGILGFQFHAPPKSTDDFSVNLPGV